MILAIILLFSYDVFSQQPDTTNVYYRLQQKSQKHKITRWIYDGIFRDPIRINDTIVPVKDNTKENAFFAYRDKIVRNIRVVSLDPFGQSVDDTLNYTPNKLEKFGNSYHVNTRKQTLKNILLFKPNKPLDPLEISESERLLRVYPYVNDARIYASIVKSAHNSDSVDITVVVQDKWTTLVWSSFDPTNPNIKIVERNLFGLGHQIEEDITLHNANQSISTAGKYTIFNTGKTFINSSLFYSSSSTINQWGVAIDRPFYSSLAKWAGGASYMRSYTRMSFLQNNATPNEPVISYPVNNQIEDVWVAKNFPVTNKKSASINKRSSNYGVGLRYYNVNYLERPSFIIDSYRINSNQTMVLNNIGFSKRKYYKDRNLFRFGANEDIPEGFSIEYVQGFLNKEANATRYYGGLKLAAGRHYDNIGYLSAGISYGTFYNKTFMGLGVLNTDINYFTDLLYFGNWSFRQYGLLQYTQGINRLPYESVNINGAQMYGYSSDLVSDKSKMILNLKMVMYTPYQLLGFRFAPVLMCGLARSGNTINDLLTGFTYQAYALGLLIRNEYLVANTFEVSIGIYPYVPGNESYLLRFNPISNYQIKPRDYGIGKPELVPYQ